MSNLAKFTALLEKHADNEDFDANERKEQKDFRKKYPVSDLDANLAMARMAVNFVRKQIPVTANDDLHLASGVEYQHFEKGVADPSKFTAADKCVYETLRPQREYQDNVCYGTNCFQKIQQLARKSKCGNCYEQAAAAFVLLVRLGVRPLDYMWLTPYQMGILDHSFVVIGRNPKAPMGVDSWQKWGPDAVVCDPWAVGVHRPSSTPSKPSLFGESFGVYPAAQLGKKMKELFPRFRSVELKHTEP